MTLPNHCFESSFPFKCELISCTNALMGLTCSNDIACSSFFIVKLIINKIDCRINLQTITIKYLNDLYVIRIFTQNENIR